MEPKRDQDSSVERPVTDPDAELSAFDIDAIAALAEFETEHQRFLAMQSLYYRRHKAGGAA